MDDQMIYWTKLLVLVTLLLVSVTFLLVLVSFFQEQIKRLFFKPILNCTIDTSDREDCHRAKLNLVVGNYFLSPYAYYFRFKIWNNGNISAENVEVIIKNVTDEKGNKIDEIFSLDNLVWSTLSETMNRRLYWSYISPNTYQFSNLGHVHDPKHRSSIIGEYNKNLMVDNKTVFFSFDIYWRTNDLRYLIKPGTYLFNIVVGASNSKTIEKKFQLSFNGNWDEGEEKMLSNFEIKELFQ
jgi:hypothetical protein